MFDIYKYVKCRITTTYTSYTFVKTKQIRRKKEAPTKK